MKRKTINAVICKKMDEWFQSIDKEDIRKIAEENTIVTGGCIASMLLREGVNDFDVYFKTHEAANAVAAYYVDRFNGLEHITHHIEGVNHEDKDGNPACKIMIKSAGVAKFGKASDYKYFEGVQDVQQQGEETAEYIANVTDHSDLEEKRKALPPFSPIFASTAAIMLTGKVQLCFKFFGTPEEIHETYDFVHATNYWTSWDRKVVLNEDALESLLTKELHFMNSKYPLSAIIRTRKFIQRGWTINAGQYLKMAMSLNELDLTNPDVLEDQLTGVDVAYFNQIIQILRDKQSKDSDFKLTSSYLATLIDKIF